MLSFKEFMNVLWHFYDEKCTDCYVCPLKDTGYSDCDDGNCVMEIAWDVYGSDDYLKSKNILSN